MKTLMRAARFKRGAIVAAAAGLALSSVVISSAASASVKLPKSGVETPSGGTVSETGSAESLWGQSVDLLTLRRRVGMLFQRPNPFPMSIKDNVVAGVKAHRIAKGKQLDVVCERRLTEVGLWDAVKDRLHDSPFRLSGGQQQLLCLARALAVGPEVLLLDEPTSALDPVTTESIEALLRTLAPALTLIVVTHNLGQAMRVSHNTIFFYQGQLLEHGPTDELFNRPKHPDTERYVTGRMG